MRPWTYPIIAFIFNYILFHSFYSGEYGGGLIIFITFPIIALSSLAFTFVHSRLDKKNIKTKYFQVAATCCIILLSYFLFPTENRPISVIEKMWTTAKNYNEITINDYFLEHRFENYEKIVAAKKKFHYLIPETSFSVNIYRLYEYGDFIENYGIIFHNGKPSSTNKKMIIENQKNGNYKFTEHFAKNSLTFNANQNQISSVKGRLDSFTVYGTGFKKEPDLKAAQTEKILKSKSPDNEYLAYRIYYWLL